MAAIPKKIQAKSSGEVDVFIYGDIGYDWWTGEDNSATRFVRDFKELELKYQRINVHINSVGGSLYDGLPIYNCIRYSPREVHTYVDGCAMSMAAIIALGGSKVHVYKSSLLMVHAPWACTCGNARDLRTEADALDKWTQTLIAAVAAKSGKDEASVTKELFDCGDHYFTPDEAKAYGLVDEIEGMEAVLPDELRASDLSSLKREAIEAAYRNAYSCKELTENPGFLQRIAAKFGITTKPPSLTTYDMDTNYNIDTKELAEVLRLPENATKEQILDAVRQQQALAAAAAAAPAAAAPATPAAPAAAPAPAAAAPAAPAAPAAAPATTAVVDAAELERIRAQAAKVDGLEARLQTLENSAAATGGGLAARLQALENSAAATGGGAPAAGDFSANPTGDKAIRAAFLGERKAIFDA
jgi:ATP-dependent Clp endopeptidase proteolytic subunit ClpP